MTKSYVSLAALMLMAACSATASPNAAAPIAVSAQAETNSSEPAMQSAPTAIAEAPAAAPVHSAQAARHASESSAAPRAHLGDAVSCEVRVRPTSNGMLIQAVAHADREIDGDYELVITKSGGGGSSDVTQSGPFTAAPGESVTLGSTELSAGGRYRAVLTLRDQSGQVCRRERRS